MLYYNATLTTLNVQIYRVNYIKMHTALHYLLAHGTGIHEIPLSSSLAAR